MDKKTTGIVSYITLIGWLIAFCAGDKEGAKFHLNQSLVLYLASLINSIIISRIPICGWAVSGILSIVFFIFWIMGLVYAPKAGFLFLCTDLPAKTGSLLSYTIFLYLYGNFV